jgi:hypothetical protein
MAEERGDAAPGQMHVDVEREAALFDEKARFDAGGRGAGIRTRALGYDAAKTGRRPGITRRHAGGLERQT